jgi:uncharacterized protein YcbX
MNVAALAIAPVKGMRVQPADALELGPTGAAGDRRFVVVGEDGALLLSTRTPKLLQIVPRLAGGTLRLEFPDGRAVEAVPKPGRRATSANYEGRPLPGHLVDGVLSAAVAEHLGRPARLLMLDPEARGADDAPVTLMSTASLHALAPVLDGSVPDPRRFRMTVTVDGASPWEEHGWGGREIAIGDVVLRGADPVRRCVVTTRDPDTGATDVPTLKALATLRGKGDVTFGIWCDVVAPGRVAIGDAVTVR